MCIRDRLNNSLNTLLKLSPKTIQAEEISQLWRKLNPDAPPRPYVGDHAKRFATSVNDLLPLVRKPRVLDIAGNRLSRDIFSKFLKAKDYASTAKTLDIEIDNWFESEIEENYFNLAILTEVIEHMSADPAHVLCSANNALAEEGLLYLTTPNIGSALGIYNLAHGHAPYHWGVLLGERGDRHQREYAANELEYLVAANGFETKMWTCDMYEKTSYHQNAARWVGKNLEIIDKSLLGDTIVIVAKKVEHLSSPIRVSPIYAENISENPGSETLAKIPSRLGKFNL